MLTGTVGGVGGRRGGRARLASTAFARGGDDRAGRVGRRGCRRRRTGCAPPPCACRRRRRPRPSPRSRCRPHPAARRRPTAPPRPLRRLHQPRAVACGLAHRVGDQRGCLGHVEPQPAGPARSGQLGRCEDQQPVAIRRGQAHGPHAILTEIKRTALENKSLVRFTIATFLAIVAEWTFFVGGLVYAFDKGGARAAGIASLAMLVPTAIAAPYAGAMAHRRRPQIVRLASYGVQSLALGGAAVAAFVDAPAAVVIGCCAIAAGAFTFLGPTCAVVLPAIVRSARELTAANVWVESCESVGMLAGSLLATLLLATQGPALVLAGGAALVLVSTIITLSSSRTESPPASHADVADSLGPVRLLLGSVRALRSRAGASGVLVMACGHFVLVGAIDLIVVVFASDDLGLGPSGSRAVADERGPRRLGVRACLHRSRAPRPPVGVADRRDRLHRDRVRDSWRRSHPGDGPDPAARCRLRWFPPQPHEQDAATHGQRHPARLLVSLPPIELFMGVGMVVGSIAAQMLIAARWCRHRIGRPRHLVRTAAGADVAVTGPCRRQRRHTGRGDQPLAKDPGVPSAATPGPGNGGSGGHRGLGRARRGGGDARASRVTCSMQLPMVRSTSTAMALMSEPQSVATDSERSPCSPTCHAPRPSRRIAPARCWRFIEFRS